VSRLLFGCSGCVRQQKAFRRKRRVEKAPGAASTSCNGRLPVARYREIPDFSHTKNGQNIIRQQTYGQNVIRQHAHASYAHLIQHTQAPPILSCGNQNRVGGRTKQVPEPPMAHFGVSRALDLVTAPFLNHNLAPTGGTPNKERPLFRPPSILRGTSNGHTHQFWEGTGTRKYIDQAALHATSSRYTLATQARLSYTLGSHVCTPFFCCI